MLKPQTRTIKAHNGRRSLCECDSETWDADADSNIVPSCLALRQGLGTRSSNMHQCCHLSPSNHCHWGLQMLRDGQRGTAKVTEQREAVWKREEGSKHELIHVDREIDMQPRWYKPYLLNLLSRSLFSCHSFFLCQTADTESQSFSWWVFCKQAWGSAWLLLMEHFPQ